MQDFYLYLWVVCGVLASLLLPIIWKAAFPGTAMPQGFNVAEKARWLWSEIKQYVLIGSISMVLGLIAFAIVKSSGGKFDNWYTAFLNGYFCEATIQKFNIY